jgi:hypothetical protein
MPISEFLEWKEFLLLHSKQDWYLAQVAAESRRAIAKEPNKIKVSDFLLVVASATEEAQERGQKSKAAWASFLGVDVKGKHN